ncbi:helix-turn-helix domain-containing protein [Kitasatospora sp. NPDC007106]|uniref:helix-turn-helix domain-containing protein n=1 Tax=Kitasatospora sp. NPDC007106 TaxID=3156914 RepID=UPI0033FEC1DC
MKDRLGTLLRRQRDLAGLTQEQLAERSGVSVRTIRRLESGRSTDHRLGTVNLLADALGLGEEDRRHLAAELTNPRGGSAFPAPESAPEQPAHEQPAHGQFGPEQLVPEQPVPEQPVPEQRVPVQPARAAGPSAPDDTPPRPPVVLAAPAPVPVHDAIAVAMSELAVEVRRRWRVEETQRRVHDPFPLPVRWQPAAASLTDHAENVQRLGPWETPREVDVSGDLRGVAEVYRRIPSGRWVILGRAGSGKSILTIRFVLDLLEGPGASVSGRVPVVFGLSSWDPTTTALRDWMIGQLLRDHPHLAGRGRRGETLAAALVDADLVLPVLDGFDEIAEGLRQEALEALNGVSLPLVLTSRREEFAEAVRAAHAPLVWAAGVELTDLTIDDLSGYLPRTVRAVPDGGVRDGDGSTTGWDAVLECLRTRESPAGVRLAAVLTTPLMVVLARTMYSEAPDRDPAELLDAARFPTVKSLEEHLLAGFVPAVYRRRAPERDVAGRRSRSPVRDPERAERWLGHLAHHLVRLDRDRHDLAWWQLADSVPLPTRILAVVLATALSVTLSDWLVALLGTRLGIGEILVQGSLMGPVAGLAFGSVYAVMVGLGTGTAFEPSRVRLALPTARAGLGRRPLRTFAARFGHGLLGGSVMGVGCACALTLERALYLGSPLTDPRVIESTLINMVCLGLTFGTAAGLVFGLMAALEAPVDVTSAATPISLLSSNRATVVRQLLVLATTLTVAIALSGRLVVELLQGPLGPLRWGLSDGLFIGAVGGIGGALSYVLAFTAWGQWIVLARVLLPLKGVLPRDPAAFLDDAYRRGVLRRTGAVYQFRHVRLQHHLGRTHRHRHHDFAPATFPPRGPVSESPEPRRHAGGRRRQSGRRTPQ